MHFVLSFSILSHENNPKNYLAVVDKDFNLIDGIKLFHKDTKDNVVIKDGYTGIACNSVQRGRIYAARNKWIDTIHFDGKSLECTNVVECGDKNHGLFMDKITGYIFLASSGDGSVYVLDEHSLEIIARVKRLDPREPETFHLNGVEVKCVSEYDDIFLLARTMHNRDGDGYVTGDIINFEEYRNIGGPIFLTGEFMLEHGLSQPHDFTFLKDGHIVCNSLLSQVLCTRSPIEKSWGIELKNYTRGLCVVGNSVYVGTSKNRSRRTSPLDPKDTGTPPDNTIFELDLDTGEVIREVQLDPALYGDELFAIEVMPEE